MSKAAKPFEKTEGRHTKKEREAQRQLDNDSRHNTSPFIHGFLVY